MSNFDPRDIPDVPPPNDEPIPFDDSDDESESIISHAPLDLGGGKEISVESDTTISDVPSEAASSPDRITGVKIFFTKLHAGSMDFLSKQINEWLVSNPGIVIKKTNITVGDIISKKTEPNIIITVWY
jgi:hypothetical protein